MRHVIIIGGGIAGLAAAYYLQTRSQGSLRYTLIEGEAGFGGKIKSVSQNGFIVEGGPDSFITQKTSALDLCQELGLGDELIDTNDAGRRVFIWSRGRLRAMPDGVMLIIPTKLMPFVTSSLISPLGKLRMGLDALIPPRKEDSDESLSHFVRRRLGAEALDKIAEPMIAGIYVADAENLSLKSTFPRFLDMEKKYGGLLRGVMAQKRAARANRKAVNAKPAQSLFKTLRGGLQMLPDAMVKCLDQAALLPNHRAVGVTREGDVYRVVLDDGTRLVADEIVFATPAFETAELAQGIAPELAGALRTIRYVSTVTVSLGFKYADLGHPLDGFGFVVPRTEQRQILACTWSSTKFQDRAPQGYALVRAFIGGTRSEYLAEQDDESLARMARDELGAMMGIRATPVLTQVYRWPKGNPQYEVGHQARIAEIDRLAKKSGIYLAGGAYHGVGIPDCIQDGARVAEALLGDPGTHPSSP